MARRVDSTVRKVDVRNEQGEVRRTGKVEARKTRTDAQKKRAEDLRIQHKYGIDIVGRDRREAEQNGKCKCCGGELRAYGSPLIDHFHFHMDASRHVDAILGVVDGWEAWGLDEREQVKCVRTAVTKVAALAAVRKAMMPWSIRALVCKRCNRALGMLERFYNAARHPDNVLPALKYLQDRLQKTFDNPEVL